MLYIHVGVDVTDDCIRNVNGYFDRNKTKDWFNRDDVKRIIKGIDNTIAVKDEYLESPVFGGMSPDRLSGGCKAVILMAVLDNPHIYATKCGDNCASYILDVAKTKDVTITLRHCMIFPDYEFEAYVFETGNYIHNRKEFINEFYKINR